jgi:L,D-transpeptidase catalytic domain
MICVALAVVVHLNLKTIDISCKNGSVIKSKVIVGGSLSPTPVGNFTTYYLDLDQVSYKKNASCFLEHQDGSHYCFHANDKSLPQSGSLGCVRLPARTWARVLIPVGTNVLVTK